MNRCLLETCQQVHDKRKVFLIMMLICCSGEFTVKVVVTIAAGIHIKRPLLGMARA